MRNLLLLSIFLTNSILAQIPNPGFENWVAGNWQLEPEGWTTLNDQLQTAVTQDLDSYDGEFAMRVEAIPDGIGGYGRAECTVPIDYIPSSLDFYAKSEIEFGAVDVTITFFNEDFLFNSFNWTGSTSIEEWTLISIPMDQNEPVLTHAVITVQALFGDLVPGTAVISVDAMGFDGPLSERTPEKLSDFRFYPNPAQDHVIIEEVEFDSQIRIIDLSGKEIYSGIVRETPFSIDVKDFVTGLYLLNITEPDQKMISQKLIIK
jgi:hypothetical protein